MTMDGSLAQIAADLRRYRTLTPEAQTRCRREASGIRPSSVGDVGDLLEALTASGELDRDDSRAAGTVAHPPLVAH